MEPYYIIIVLSAADWEKLDIDAVNGALNKGLAWVRGAGISWLVKTSSTIDTWYRRFEALLPDGCELYIGKIDLTTRAGFLQKATWDWIYSETGEAAIFNFLQKADKPDIPPSSSS